MLLAVYFMEGTKSFIRLVEVPMAIFGKRSSQNDNVSSVESFERSIVFSKVVFGIHHVFMEKLSDGTVSIKFYLIKVII